MVMELAQWARIRVDRKNVVSSGELLKICRNSDLLGGGAVGRPPGGRAEAQTLLSPPSTRLTSGKKIQSCKLVQKKRTEPDA